MEESTQPQSLKKSGLDTAMRIFIATAYAYTAAFGFAAGFGVYFGIPTFLIEANLKYLYLLFISIGTAIGLLAALDSVPAWSSTIPVVVRKSLIACIILPGSTALLFGLMFGYEMLSWWLLLGLLLLVAAYEFLPPLLFTRGVSGFVAKLDAYWKRNSSKKLEQQFSTRLFDRLGQETVIRGGVAVLGLLLSVALGFRFGRLQDTFLVSRVGAPCAVLQTYSDTLLCDEFDEQTRRTKGIFRFIAVRDITLSLETVGPLLPREGKKKITSPAPASAPQNP